MLLYYVLQKSSNYKNTKKKRMVIIIFWHKIRDAPSNEASLEYRSLNVSGLEEVANTGEDTGSGALNIVACVEVEEAKTVAAEEAYGFVVQRHSNSAENVELFVLWVVAIPRIVVTGIQYILFNVSVAWEGIAEGGTSKNGQTGFAAKIETKIEQNGNINQELSVFGSGSDWKQAAGFSFGVVSGLDTKR